MTTLHYLDDEDALQSIAAQAFVLNGKALLAVDETGSKRSVAVYTRLGWRASSGRLRQLRFAGDALSVRHDETELHRTDEIRLTGSRGRLPRLGKLATLDHGLWHLAEDAEPRIGRLVVTQFGYLPAPVRTALAA